MKNQLKNIVTSKIDYHILQYALLDYRFPRNSMDRLTYRSTTLKVYRQIALQRLQFFPVQRSNTIGANGLRGEADIRRVP